MTARSSNKADVEARVASLAWHTAERDDARVARTLHDTHGCDEVYAIDKATFFDELFHYMHEIGIWPLLEGLDPAKRKKPLYPFIRFVLFTIMRCVGGVPSMLATQDVLLTDEAFMALLGFNATQVREGSTRRGAGRRQKPAEIRGAFSYETVADNLVEISIEKLEALLNGAIQCLARQGIFPKNIDAILDTTDNEATPKYKTDDGRAVPLVTRKKRPDVRANRHASKTEVTVFGWKIWVVWEPVSRIPLAIRMDGINEADNKHAFSVLEQARKNVEGHSKIRSVALDRGFLDGKLLSSIDAQKIIVYIPAKSNLQIAVDAREIAKRAAAEAARGRTLDGCVYRERTREVTIGAGKNARKEVRTTTVVGISELPCEFWNANPNRHASEDHRKDFQARMLHATVVLRWDGAPDEADKEVVLLTTNPSKDPFVAFDAYDDRSLIENTCNREAKEAWFLEHHPKRSEAGVRAHSYFVFFCMALVAAFRAYKAKTDKGIFSDPNSGIVRYRRALTALNRDKVAVFSGLHFGIFRNWEFALLAGVTVHKRAQDGETAQSVLHRYGAGPPPSDSS